MKIIYDVRHDLIHNHDPLGSSGYMSFKRLAELINAGGEVRHDEMLTHIIVTPRGLDLRFANVGSTA
jgi:hypothetical protein